MQFEVAPLDHNFGAESVNHDYMFGVGVAVGVGPPGRVVGYVFG